MEVKKLTHEQHVLQLPDTYVGDIELVIKIIWHFVIDKMIKCELKYIPGEYKLFDEIIVNAFDQYVRLNEMEDDSLCLVKNIKITANKETGVISVYNDGEGISVKIHPKEKKYIPELIFGDLLTSSNYNKDQIKHVGGKNGYGAKLTNIFSKSFSIETVDRESGQKFSMNFFDNKTRKSKPKITKNSGKPYTKITYLPDYARFGTEGLSDDMYKLMLKRAYDLSATTGNKVNIYFNGDRLATKNFEQYADLYLGSKKDHPRVYGSCGDRWEFIVGLSPSLYFEQVSFVNGINTSEGGKHVDYIVNQITKKLSEWIKKKKKLNIKPILIKENLIVFIKAVIDNPSFSSQTKETLTTNKEKFGSKCEITDKFIEQVSKCGIVEKAIELSDAKSMKQMSKTDGKKQNRLKGIPKLEDANLAGTKSSRDCTLIITEGDSAKSSAMAGLEKIGRDTFGVFPLKGKVLNVRGISPEKIIQNTEISNLKKIIGLQTGQTYSTEGKWPLRYGKLLILTDQDEDGSHIKGLVFNLFLTLWPSLYYMDGFLNSMLTPIVKCKKGKLEKMFYSLGDYEKFKKKNPGWQSKYYKGLGTSTAKESKIYFEKMQLVTYTNPVEEERQFIDLAFAKEEGCADKRKKWLSEYSKSDTLDYSKMQVTIGDFVNRDLKHFSNSDNIRSIPSMVDGLKPSQRKVLFGAFKRNLTKTEIKVAQLAGFVSEHTGYHHGEASLQGTIVNLAQNFVGSNNINLLEPMGQFGTRIGGGKDAAQPRYIFTKLCKHTQEIFNTLDNPLYKYNYDDTTKVEPEYYVPILPMILVNGTQGIGTGWSTDVPCFNPKDLVNNMKRHMEGEEMVELVPFYRGFEGQIKLDKAGKTYITKGTYVISDSKIIITELPVGMWTDKYKEFLETLVIDSKKPTKKQIIRYYNSYCTDTKIHFELILSNEQIEKMDVMDWKLGYTTLEKQLKLVSNLSMTNMVLYDRNNQIKKYKTPLEILQEFCETRLHFYIRRKEHLLVEIKKDIEMLKIKIRFINMFIEDKIQIIKKNKKEIEGQLETLEFRKVDGNFDYLIKMPIYSLSKDKMDELQEKFDTLVLEMETLSNKTNKDLWLDDLEQLNINKMFKKSDKKKLKINKKK